MTSTLTRPLQRQLPPRSQMDDLELQQLVRSIQASPNRQDPVVRKQINLLIPEVYRRLQGAKGALIKEFREKKIPNIESIVGEAIDNRLIEAINSIDKYDPNQASFVTWINNLLRFRVIDSIEKHTKNRETSTDAPTSEDHPISTAEIELNEIIEEEERARTQDREMNHCAVKLREFIEKDPEGHLEKTHIRNKPDVTFQTILLMRLDGKTWQQIADLCTISSYSTINVFHDRNLHKFNDYFRNNLCEYWYQ